MQHLFLDHFMHYVFQIIGVICGRSRRGGSDGAMKECLRSHCHSSSPSLGKLALCHPLSVSPSSAIFISHPTCISLPLSLYLSSSHLQYIETGRYLHSCPCFIHTILPMHILHVSFNLKHSTHMQQSSDLRAGCRPDPVQQHAPFCGYLGHRITPFLFQTVYPHS